MKELVIYTSKAVGKQSEITWSFYAVAYDNGVEMGEVAAQIGHSRAEYGAMGADLKGVMAGLLWAKKNGYDTVSVYYTYEGTAKWVTGEWRARSEMASTYREWMLRIGKEMNHVEFVKATVENRTEMHYAYLLACSALKDVIMPK